MCKSPSKSSSPPGLRWTPPSQKAPSWTPWVRGCFRVGDLGVSLRPPRVFSSTTRSRSLLHAPKSGYVPGSSPSPKPSRRQMPAMGVAGRAEISWPLSCLPCAPVVPLPRPSGMQVPIGNGRFPSSTCQEAQGEGSNPVPAQGDCPAAKKHRGKKGKREPKEQMSSSGFYHQPDGNEPRAAAPRGSHTPGSTRAVLSTILGVSQA